MKIMIHSNGPMVPSGYGQQTRLLMRQFTDLGHEVAVSSYHGVTGSIIEVDGVPVYPAGRTKFGMDTILAHAEHFGADLLLTLMDTYQLIPIVQGIKEWVQDRAGRRVACWTPVDCCPMSRADQHFFRMSEALPIAMSEYGLHQMQHAGLSDAVYVPHSIDTQIFRPITGLNVREQLGVPADAFVIGICAANRDMFRKSFHEQFRAFDLHRRRHPDSQLWVHTIADGMGSGGYRLEEIVDDFGLSGSVRFTPAYVQVAGLMDDQDMAIWFNTINLLSNCSYGEGFGLPIVEAQACGTPAVATDTSSMSELAEYLVDGEEWWNSFHRAWWRRPSIPQITAVYDLFADQHAENGPGGPPVQSLVERMAAFDVDYVAQTYWKPLLGALGGVE